MITIDKQIKLNKSKDVEVYLSVTLGCGCCSESRNPTIDREECEDLKWDLTAILKLACERSDTYLDHVDSMEVQVKKGVRGDNYFFLSIDYSRSETDADDDQNGYEGE